MSDQRDALIEIVALQEEVNSMNYRLKQLIESLNSDDAVLSNVKHLSKMLMEKTTNVVEKINSYTPDKLEDSDGPIPSYVKEGKDREVIYPGPDNTYINPTTIKDKVVEEPVEEVVDTEESDEGMDIREAAKLVKGNKRKARGNGNRKPLGNKVK
tara:strand:- start:273 stop:737 length:465 start_codon:yes stop_codon:yes gene_type:complete